MTKTRAAAEAPKRPTSLSLDPRTALEERIAAIPQLDVAILRAEWAALFGRPPPMTLGRRLLEYAAAYKAQAAVFGGLKPALRRKLLQATSQRARVDGAATRKRPAALTPCTRLVREWRGRPHSVEIRESGFIYAGRSYRSLSQVAQAITGARWSGPRFFGL